jgi:DNA-binding transcriptional ArsR family regulator
VAASSDVFRAIADPTRRAVLERLRDADRSASELARPFRMSMPALSQHLRVLREAGLVTVRQDGRQRLYRLDARPLDQVYRWASRLVIDPSGHAWALRPARRPAREQDGS